MDHVIILDGTMSSLRDGEQSNAGLVFQLLKGAGTLAGPHPARRSLYYDAGLPWPGWRRLLDLVEGRGIEEQILRAYGHLASHYRAGDRIFLFGYSRGAFAVRSMAGIIDRIGLLRHDMATERNLRLVWRHYRQGGESAAARDFAARFCHPAAPIRMVGVWDTVMALGLRLPLLWMLSERRYAFHNTRLGRHIEHGFHALALDETRKVFEPLLWQSDPDGPSKIEQVWFRGAHGDVGGQLGPHEAARPLSNIPLVWMLDRAESVGLTLPTGWRASFPCNPAAPMMGTWRGLASLFLYRRKRRIGLDPSERLHESLPETARLQRQIATHPRGLSAK